MYSGKIDPQKMAAIRQGDGDPESQIRTLLSPDQQTAYDAFRDEEKTELARSSTNVEFLQMQSSLSLTDDQQDKVFRVLFDHSLQQLKTNADNPSPENPAETMRLVIDRKLQALAGVLTPIQLAVYRQQQEAQLKFMKDIMARVETPATRP